MNMANNDEKCPKCERGDLFPLTFKRKVKYNCTELEVTTKGHECCACREVTFFPEDVAANDEALTEAKLDYDLSLEDDV
jgi:hypothetical protein